MFVMVPYVYIAHYKKYRPMESNKTLPVVDIVDKNLLDGVRVPIERGVPRCPHWA